MRISMYVSAENLERLLNGEKVPAQPWGENMYYEISFEPHEMVLEKQQGLLKGNTFLIQRRTEGAPRLG
jgi:hypothetical protein